MPSRFKPIAIASVLILVIAGYFYLQVDWEVRAIRQQFKQLAELVEKDGAVSTFEAVGRSRQLANTMAAGASIEYYPGRRLPRDVDAMSAAFLSVWKNLDKASVRVMRHEVVINEAATEAESQLTAACSVIFDGAEQMGDTIKYRIYWSKVDGDWLIQEVIALGEG